MIELHEKPHAHFGGAGPRTPPTSTMDVPVSVVEVAILGGKARGADAGGHDGERCRSRRAARQRPSSCGCADKGAVQARPASRAATCYAVASVQVPAGSFTPRRAS